MHPRTSIGSRGRSETWAQPKKKRPGVGAPGRGPPVEPFLEPRSQTVEDLIRPEPLEAVQRLVQRRELVGIDPTNLLDGAHVLLIERIDDVAHLAALLGQLDAHRAAIDPRALMVEEAHLDELLEVIGDVGAEIVAARA